MNGKFIVFEGMDFCGKSIQSELLHKKMQNSALTREPGENTLPLCRDLRGYIVDPTNGVSEKTKALLFLADRSHHIDSYIRPLIYSGKDVISDRFYISSLVYNKILGYGLEANVDLVNTMKPDITIFIDVDYKTVLERRKGRRKLEINDELNEKEFEAKRMEYKDTLYREYEEGRMDRLIMIGDNGLYTPEQIHFKIMIEISKIK